MIHSPSKFRWPCMLTCMCYKVSRIGCIFTVGHHRPAVTKRSSSHPFRLSGPPHNFATPSTIVSYSHIILRSYLAIRVDSSNNALGLFSATGVHHELPPPATCSTTSFNSVYPLIGDTFFDYLVCSTRVPTSPATNYRTITKPPPRCDLWKH